MNYLNKFSMVTPIVIFLSILCFFSQAFAVLDAQLISDNIPSGMHPGETRRLSVVMENTGDEPWTDPDFRLSSLNIPNNLWFYIDMFLQPGETINPGGQKDFQLYLQAPDIPDTYDSNWQMKDYGTTSLFGDTVSDSILVDVSIQRTWDSLAIDNTLPTELYPDEPRLISITFENTGAGDWTGNRYALASKNLLRWQEQEFYLFGDTETVLANGGQRVFELVIVAPSAEDTYDCTWQLINIGPNNIYFGQELSQPINVSTSVIPQLGSLEIENTIPIEMQPSETRSATITLENTGSVTWDETNVRLHALNGTWGAGVNYFLAPGETVAQGEQKTFTIIITSPSAQAIYDCEWQMQRIWNTAEGARFGNFGAIVSEPVDVNSSVTPFLDAVVVGHTIPASMGTSETVSVTVTLENTGTATWDGSDPSRTRLRTQNSPTGLWGTFQTYLDSGDSILPGQQKTFTFDITSPATGGSYNCRWQLQKQWPNQTSFFGELLDVPVQVGVTAEICDDGIDNDDDTFIDCADPDCDGQTCDDGDICTSGEICSSSACGGGSPVDCDDGNVCTDDVCTAGVGCEYTNNTDPCDDGLYCNGDDTCSGGNCTHSGDPCPPQVCVEEGSGSCVDCTLDGDCDDGVACTVNTCAAGTCTFTPNDANCPDDGLFCTGTEFCDAVLDCSSTGDPCAPDLCDDDLDECVELGDFDEDGIPDISDNCPQVPNGPLLGTCLYGLIEGTCMTNEECGLNGFCGMNQEDNYPGPDGNGLGDACECEGDFDCDGDVDGSDANLFKRDFGRSILYNPCPNCL